MKQGLWCCAAILLVIFGFGKVFGGDFFTPDQTHLTPNVGGGYTVTGPNGYTGTYTPPGTSGVGVYQDRSGSAFITPNTGGGYTARHSSGGSTTYNPMPGGGGLYHHSDGSTTVYTPTLGGGGTYRKF